MQTGFEFCLKIFITLTGTFSPHLDSSYLTFYLRSVPFKKYKAQVDTWMLAEVEKNRFWASAELPEAPLVLVIGTDKAANQ